MLLLVAATVAQVALGAGRCDGVGHTCSDDRIGEGSLPAPWGQKSGESFVRADSGGAPKRTPREKVGSGPGRG